MTKLTLIIGNKNYSSWSLRPWLFMKQFGLDFDEVRIPLYMPESKQQIKQYSPSGKVPVLLHDDITIWDSLAICEYLTEQFPHCYGLPEGNRARAIARCISAEMHSGFLSLRQNMPMNCRAKLPGKGMTSEVQQDINRITDIWRSCRDLFGSGGDMLFGKFAIADAMFAPVVLRFITYNVTLDSVCQDYANAILALPAIKEWIKAAETEAEIIPSFEH
ncbi:MAG TPA: glutathione S-transferase [Cyanobacteria bacterium UBA11159]|nr:glutathione S-transferase [Cyanobacteria bacterium UBA11367]HBE60321.1 glutathione S-transferase [Cyanobacteria bacterium UBA11366]HBR72637.1 glutathione S-transferase [Cyanobacteria bacterium UBA11159]HBS68758.1 glutathione S-transferase [Cyanobacteria bacterium UBA11153]HCA98137.1 glutathione S-transferase [Cyanobacteria bacterium UBA9226]